MFRRRALFSNGKSGKGADSTNAAKAIHNNDDGKFQSMFFVSWWQQYPLWSSALLMILLAGGFVILAFPNQGREHVTAFRGSTSQVRTSSSSTTTTTTSSTNGLRQSNNRGGSSSTIVPNFEPIHKECTVWIAPSSLKGVNGYGVFTTRDLDADESILGIPDGVAIPVETDWDETSPKEDEREAWWDVWGNYVWGRGLPDHARFYASEEDAVMDFQIGFGALPNHHCILNSLSRKYPIPPYDDTMVDRFRDPGAGAFTYSRGREFMVKRSLKAGSEIFLSYGYCSHHEHSPKWLENVYVTGDYEEAASRIWKTIGDGTEEGEEESGDDTEKEEYSILEFESTGKLLPPEEASRLVTELLPQTKKELESMKEQVGSKEEIIWYLATHKSLNPRSPEWIRQHGMCLENLRPMPSTLPQAGQGGFAQYTIAKGDIVMPAPLLQIADKEVLKVYENGNFVGHQLLLNYCFGHSQSSLLLCPDTQAQLINHCSTRTRECGKQGPNAAIRWAQGWDATSDKWQTYSLEQIGKETGRGLSFEVYALRDIQPGEEVFIDYGVEWEQAWQAHVQSYRLPKLVDGWITAKEANEMEKILPNFIAGDLRQTVNHPYLFTGCQYNDKYHSSLHKEHSRDDWKEYSDEKILKVFGESGADYVYKDKYGNGGYGYSRHRDKSHWPCSILKEEGEGTDALGEPTTLYTVRIHQSPFKTDTSWAREGLPRILTSYPRSAIYYMVKPYAGDQFLPGAFRHAMGIPDEMFPDHWKDLASER